MPRLAPPPPPLTQPERLARMRFVFGKLGDARWLSHRNVMDLLERALRAADVPVRYTEGYNPHIRLSMGPALALGHEALAEPFDVDCHAAVSEQMLERANRVLPDGLTLDSVHTLPEGTRKLGKSVRSCRYRVSLCRGAAIRSSELERLGAVAGVLAWREEGDDLLVTLNARQTDGPTPGVKKLLAELGVEDEVALQARVIREAVLVDGWEALDVERRASKVLQGEE
jgi:radical SAM-linked protein